MGFKDGYKSLKRNFINRYQDGEKEDAYRIITGEVSCFQYRSHSNYKWSRLFWCFGLLPLFYYILKFISEGCARSGVGFLMFVVLVFVIFSGFEWNTGMYCE